MTLLQLSAVIVGHADSVPLDVAARGVRVATLHVAVVFVTRVNVAILLDVNIITLSSHTQTACK